MQIVKCPSNALNQMYEVFDNMTFLAEEFVPDKRDLIEICDNLSEYMPFLLWIEETGITTEENKELRGIIKQIILKHLDVVEDEQEV